MSESFDVVIIGGGCSGLYASHLLRLKGIRVKLLEAQGLLGGRTYHRTGLFQWPVDLGGEFIHGQLTHFKELCDKLGIATIRTFSSFPPTPYFEDGRPVAEYVWLGRESRLVSWVEAQEKDKDFAHFLDVIAQLEESKDVRPNENLYQYLTRQGVAQRVLGLADAVYAKTWAADLCDLSVRGCIHEADKPDTGRDNYILENSTADLVKALSKGLDVDLNQEVVSISSDTKSRIVTVKTKAGKTFTAARVIVGVPVTSLTSIQFSPPLPRPFQEAVAGAGVGVSVKAIIKFKRAFWPRNVLLCFCADAPIPQLWMDPPRPNYAGEEGHAITCFATGTPAIAMAQMPAWKQLHVCLTQLDAMFGTKADRRPASDSYDDHSICKWDTIAYTYPSGISPEILCGPVASNTVFFCGEHCGTNMSEIATINGALESARFAASGVLESLGKVAKL